MIVRVEFLINYEMACLEQMYIIFLNLADNHYEEDYNELIVIQKPLNEVYFRRFYF